MAPRDYSKKQENYIAEVLGMRRTSNSGATVFDKGDVEDEHFLIECKTLMSKQKSRTIQKEWFTEIRREMFEMGRQLSAVAFDFGDIGNRSDTFIAFPIDDALQLIECFRREIEESEL